MFFSHFRHFPGTQQLLPTTILLEFTQNNTGGRVQSWKSAFLGVERVQNFSSCQPTIRFQAARAQTRRLYWSNCDAESVPVSPLHLSHVRRLSDGERRWFQYESNESALAVSWDEACGTYVASLPGDLAQNPIWLRLFLWWSLCSLSLTSIYLYWSFSSWVLFLAAGAGPALL